MSKVKIKTFKSVITGETITPTFTNKPIVNSKHPPRPIYVKSDPHHSYQDLPYVVPVTVNGKRRLKRWSAIEMEYTL